jgi:hypothetical protein
VPDAIDEFFGGYTPEMQAVSRELRGMVKRVMPGANEGLFAGYNLIGYGFSESMRDRICYICPMKDYVRLGFMYGGSLPDPEQMLEGTGKRLRHVKVRTEKAAGAPALERLVEAAWADGITHMKTKA